MSFQCSLKTYFIFKDLSKYYFCYCFWLELEATLSLLSSIGKLSSSVFSLRRKTLLCKEITLTQMTIRSYRQQQQKLLFLLLIIWFFAYVTGIKKRRYCRQFLQGPQVHHLATSAICIQRMKAIISIRSIIIALLLTAKYAPCNGNKLPIWKGKRTYYCLYKNRA